jgi:hypothetical protein
MVILDQNTFIGTRLKPNTGKKLRLGTGIKIIEENYMDWYFVFNCRTSKGPWTV